MKSGLTTYTPRSTSVLLKFDYPEGSPGEHVGTQILGLCPGGSDSVGLGRTQEIASLCSRCQHVFESHCSTLSHFWPLVLVPSCQISSRPINCSQSELLCPVQPSDHSVCVAFIDHPGLGLFLNRIQKKGPKRPPVPTHFAGLWWTSLASWRS